MRLSVLRLLGNLRGNQYREESIAAGSRAGRIQDNCPVSALLAQLKIRQEKTGIRFAWERIAIKSPLILQRSITRYSYRKGDVRGGDHGVINGLGSHTRRIATRISGAGCDCRRGPIERIISKRRQIKPL